VATPSALVSIHVADLPLRRRKSPDRRIFSRGRRRFGGGDGWLLEARLRLWKKLTGPL